MLHGQEAILSLSLPSVFLSFSLSLFCLSSLCLSHTHYLCKLYSNFYFITHILYIIIAGMLTLRRRLGPISIKKETFLNWLTSSLSFTYKIYVTGPGSGPLYLFSLPLSLSLSLSRSFSLSLSFSLSSVSLLVLSSLTPLYLSKLYYIYFYIKHRIYIYSHYRYATVRKNDSFPMTLSSGRGTERALTLLRPRGPKCAILGCPCIMWSML